ncbi:TetR family transcriptional regulator [Paenibacillus oryzae]|uniref:TetR family transcriptional regulator n=1 Tax=Paenibacillus oryzae TaxID=1844972 RepID=A0A1A5Y9Q9_9BACL|nr:TetR/AcrR family transcriptional regulator [Paenibacillus oryzae]OBR62313.1 TetR family transcriptional regulator [Paenibacillus oryzae]
MSVDRRQLIVEAAAKSFSMFGYKATTMDGVARIASVGKGTIYTFFANKEELFQVIMKEMILEMKNVAESVIQPNHHFFDNLNAALERLLDFREQHELALKLLQEVREIGTPMAVEALEQLERAVISYISAQVGKAVERKEIKPCDPQMTAFVMLKLYMALAVDWKNMYGPISKQQLSEKLRFYLEIGLASDDAGAALAKS